MAKRKAETLLENYQALAKLYHNVREELSQMKKAQKKKTMKLKYALDNIIDIIDGACNLYVLMYVIICIIVSTKNMVIPFGMLKDWVNIGAIIALAGMIFIPSKDQRKEMSKRK